MHKLQRKLILIGIPSIIVVALVIVFAIPAIASGSFSFPPWGPGPNKNMTVEHGTITALTPNSIKIGNYAALSFGPKTSFTIHGTGQSWFSVLVSSDLGSLVGEPATATYNNTVTPVVASQVMINMPTPGPGKPPPNKNLASVQGTITSVGVGTIDITFTEPSSITLGMPTNTAVTILYNTSIPYTIQGLMSTRNGPVPTPPNNLATVQGEVQSITPAGTITITFTEPSSVPLMGTPANKAVNILYNTISPYSIQGLMSTRPGGGFPRRGP